MASRRRESHGADVRVGGCRQRKSQTGLYTARRPRFEWLSSYLIGRSVVVVRHHRVDGPPFSEHRRDRRQPALLDPARVEARRRGAHQNFEELRVSREYGSGGWECGERERRERGQQTQLAAQAAAGSQAAGEGREVRALMSATGRLRVTVARTPAVIAVACLELGAMTR